MSVFLEHFFVGKKKSTLKFFRGPRVLHCGKYNFFPVKYYLLQLESDLTNLQSNRNDVLN